MRWHDVLEQTTLQRTLLSVEMRMFLLSLLLLLHRQVGSIEEFHVHSPSDLQNLAMDAFTSYRRDVDPNAGFGSGSPLMKQAEHYAVKRLSMSPESALLVRSFDSGDGTGETPALGGSSGGTARPLLPAPQDLDGDAVLAAAAVSTQQSSYELMSVYEANAMATSFGENVGMGAISKAGALPLGDRGAWLALVDDKRKKDNALDYQAALWELGSEAAEQKQIERGGVNITSETDTLDRLKKWFIDGGGRLHFAEPRLTPDNQGFRLRVSENVISDDTVLSIPLKLIMCRQTARNIVIAHKGKYLGEELTKAFDKNEEWAMAIFLLHEYFKEVDGMKSKWGPYVRALRMRALSTDAVQELRGTKALQLMKQWMKSTEDFLWWSAGSDGPCSPISGICKVKPSEKHSDSRFSLHQLRWAYWVVKQNAVKIKQASTGLEFIALVPYYDMLEKSPSEGGSSWSKGQMVFGLDGSVTVKAGADLSIGASISVDPGNYTDPEYFLRYLSVPTENNPHNYIKLSLPGAVPQGSKFHFCMKGNLREQNRDVCKGTFKSESMFWKSKVLGEWRAQMNLPPRLQDLRMWANRLHLYGGKEEMDLLSTANSMIAGLPIPVEQMPAEEQMALLGISPSALVPSTSGRGRGQGTGAGGDGEVDPPRPLPQLYTAPDPTEDAQAQRAMEALAVLAHQAQTVWATGNAIFNATRAVLNQTRDFFLHGVLPDAGLDQLDEFLLKKIGMLAHCGFENNMKIQTGNITEELMCAMRVHLMNESEMHVFCPKEVRIWEESCHNVEFLNYTAISEGNELAVVSAFRNSLRILLDSYPHTRDDDEEILKKREAGLVDLGPVVTSAVRYRRREKSILISALEFLNGHEAAVINGTVPFQLAMKAQERVEANVQEEQRRLFMEKVQERAANREPLAVLEVTRVDRPKVNLTLEEGHNLVTTVAQFCTLHGVGDADRGVLQEALLRRVVSPSPLAILLGVVVPTGHRRILGIPQGANITMETHIFCAKYDVTSLDLCDSILERVKSLVDVDPDLYVRKVILTVPIDAPDGRTLKLLIREGEQHDLRQYVADFFELYRMPADFVGGMVAEVNKRMPAVALQIPVDVPGKRRVVARFTEYDNITSTVEAFANYFEVTDAGLKLAITKRARHALAPGTYLV